MKKLLIIPLVLLALAGCKTTGTTTTTTPPAETQVGQAVEKVQSVINQTCGYVVTFDSIINLVAAFTGKSGIVDVQAMVKEVCNALAKPTFSRSKKNRAVMVRGVRVEVVRR